jgi:uroporphyrinogen III methyltransferase/synthase
MGAAERLTRADVVIADYLANPAFMMHCRSDVVLHQRQAGPRSGAKLDQQRVNELMVSCARRGEYVVRLKGGDPVMFGRGAEEAQYLRAHDVPYEILPGVTSPLAGPEMAGIPLTHRDHTPAVTFVSGFEAYKKAGLGVAWEHLAKSAGTLVFLMGVRNVGDNMQRLIEAGRDPSTPAAAVRWGTRGIQQTVVGEVATIADKIAEVGLRAPALIVVGEVVKLREEIQWFEQKPLFGKRVVVTRAIRQAGGLVQRLAGEGADAVAFPCLEVAPPEDPTPLQDLPGRLDAVDGLMLTSPNGVSAFFEALDAAGRDVRALAGMQVAVVGTGTAAACRERGLLPDIIPDVARSEALVQSLQDKDLLGRHWVHVRGVDGRKLLQQAIEAANGTYDLVPGYRTLRPKVAGSLLRSLRTPDDGGEGAHAICFASGKTARHFVETLSEGLGKDEAMEICARARVITIGPVTTSAVEALGITVHATATETSDAGMVAAVRDALGAD